MNKLEWKTSSIQYDFQDGSNDKTKTQTTHKRKKLIYSLLFAMLTAVFQFLILRSCTTSSAGILRENNYAVAVAKTNIKQGEMATENNIKIIYMDVGMSKESFILNSELNSYFGKRFLTNTKENTPVLKNAFVSEFQRKSIPENIPPGKRLFALDVDLGPLSTLLHLGDKIDVIAHMEIPEFGKVTESILEAIEIVGIGDNIGNEGSSEVNQTLSFYVTPEEVKILSFMKQYAHFSIALRNPNDLSSKSGAAVTLNKFIQDERIQRIMKNDSFKIIK